MHDKSEDKQILNIQDILRLVVSGSGSNFNPQEFVIKSDFKELKDDVRELEKNVQKFRVEFESNTNAIRETLNRLEDSNNKLTDSILILTVDMSYIKGEFNNLKWTSRAVLILGIAFFTFLVDKGAKYFVG